MRVTALALGLVLVAATANAHVTVWPRESRAGAGQQLEDPPFASIGSSTQKVRMR